MRLYKLISIVCLSFIIMNISTIVHAEQAIIEADQLNVRTGPGTHFERIHQVNTDEIYQIIQIQGDWIEIELDDGSGWITSEYITIDQQSEESAANNGEDEKDIPEKEDNKTPNGQTSLTISNENTQIRKGPSVDYEIIMYAKKDQQFEVISEEEKWYEVVVNEGTGYIFKGLIDHQQSNVGNHLQNRTIVIDAGHGGHDVGAIGINGSYEKDHTLKTTSELTTTLTMLGANVILTRSNDDYIRLASRPILANVYHADAFLSIHYNSFTDLATVSGIDTYYYDDHDENFANIVQKELIQVTDANDRGVNYGDFQVLRQTLQPGLLLELGFISNPEKEELLSTNGYQRKLVKGITTGLEKYFAK